MDILRRIESKAGILAAEKKTISEVPEEELDYLQKVLSEKEAELEMLKAIKECWNAPAENKEFLLESINSYLSLNERNYLHAKVLAAFTKKFPLAAENPSDLDLIYGKPQNNFYKFEKDGSAYRFTLPHLISKYTVYKTVSDGQAVSKLVRFLMRKYEEETGDILPVMKKAKITFTHYVKKNQIPDPDNLEVKSVIDSLKGKLIEEDDVLRLTLTHHGILSENAFTEVCIEEKKESPETDFSVADFRFF